MAFSAMTIANEIIKRAHTKGTDYSVSNMKLQKLVYFAQGWYLAIMDEPLFDENIEAWRYGPVVPDLYHSFKLYFNNPIPLDHYFTEDTGSIEHDETAVAVIEEVLNVFGKTDASELVRITHLPETPWHKVYNGGRNIQIPQDIIKSYFVNS